MAIKGKSRSRGAKAVARGPKPAYVPVRRPLLARRGFWIGVAVVLAVAAAVGIAYGVVQDRNRNRERDREQARAAAVREYAGQLDSVLQGIGQPQPPSGFTVFTDLAPALDALERGEGSVREAATTGTAASEDAASAAETIRAIDAVAIVRDRGLDQAFILYVLGSKDDIVSALRLYEEAGSLVALAAATPEDGRADLVDRARGVLAVADEVFARGYDSYVQAQALAGTFQPTFGAPTGPAAG